MQIHEPTIEYKTVVINKDNAGSFSLLPGVRGVYRGQDNKIVIYRYSISDDIPESLRTTICQKVKKLYHYEPIILAHEKHHAQNRQTIGAIQNIAKNIYEYIGLHALDEASAFSAGALHGKPHAPKHVLRAAIDGTEEFLSKTSFYFSKLEHYLLSSVVCFDTKKTTHVMIRKYGDKIFNQDFSSDFQKALSAYFTFDGYALFKDKQLYGTPQWQQLVTNIQKIKALCIERASIIANEVLNNNYR